MIKNINNKKYIERFEKNLREWNEENDRDYTFEDVQDKFIHISMYDEENTEESQCMCGHIIHNLYYIENPENEDRMILGSDCIQTYMIKSLSICTKCKCQYKFNPNSNVCKDCTKVKVKCKKCQRIRYVRRSKKKLYDKCKKCKEEETKKQCKLCDKVIKPEYTYCYSCYKYKCKIETFKKRLFTPTK